jgi:hypothetical protein
LSKKSFVDIMYGDVKEMRESVYRRRRGGFGAFEEPAWVMERGDSAREATKRVEVEGVVQVERVTSASSKLPNGQK